MNVINEKGILGKEKDEIIKSFLSPISNEWYIHSIQVAFLSLLLAESYDLNEEKTSLLVTSAIWHDVAKVFDTQIAQICAKEGKLTPNERKIINTHANKSALILQEIFPGQDEMFKLVASHHTVQKEPLVQILVAADIACSTGLIDPARKYLKVKPFNERLSFAVKCINEKEGLDKVLIKRTLNSLLILEMMSINEMSNRLEKYFIPV